MQIKQFLLMEVKLLKYEVFNLHFTDICNYSCRYCFINKQKKVLSFEKIKLIIDNIKRYFVRNEIKDGRINLSGGEPLTCSYLQDIIDYILMKNISVSLITNGSLLSPSFISHNKHKISMIGISVDSLNVKTNTKIGRCDFNQNTLSKVELIKLCDLIKSNGIKLKINICVSKYNLYEQFSDFLKIIKPDRLKILQMTVIDGSNNIASRLTVTDDEYKQFCKQYLEFSPIQEVSEMLQDGYLIIDSHGNIGINNSHHIKSFNLTEIELSDVILQIALDEKHYIYRYL